MSGYIKDKPTDCRYCYYWTRAEPHCIYGFGQCFYTLQDPYTQDTVAESECADCPYGKYSPCIGWCSREILRSIKGGGGHGL